MHYYVHFYIIALLLTLFTLGSLNCLFHTPAYYLWTGASRINRRFDASMPSNSVRDVFYFSSRLTGFPSFVQGWPPSDFWTIPWEPYLLSDLCPFLSNLLQMANNCIVVSVEFICNFPCCYAQISLDYSLQLVVVNFRWALTTLFILKALVL